MASAVLTFGCSGILKNGKYLRFNYTYCRRYSQQKAAKKTTAYSGSLLLPQTEFPARHKAAQRTEIENEITKKGDFAGLYSWQRDHLKGPDFVLHDGPPYANGDPHIGHAVNKILKDITTRSRVVHGQRVHYVPGWDCHGLPIELKALRKDSSAKSQTSAVEIRASAREFALNAARRQRASFESWGVMADWENGCYYTLKRGYVQDQLRRFHAMFEKGLIYRDVKPVYWSPSSGTALAEAELEYDQQHKSTQVYLELPLVSVPEKLKALSKSGDTFSAVIWSTTPWSLVGNQAICYNSALRYSAVSVDGSKRLLIVAQPLIQELTQVLGKPLQEEFSFEGSILADAQYCHPLKSDLVLPFLEGDHVLAEKGTGLVHTAPAHGPEDFLVALKHKIKVECYVDEKGCYSGFGPSFDGLLALKDGQRHVLETLGERVLYSGPFVHPYPLDWRTGKPVIIRASSQWFIDTTAIRENALAALEGVTILPALSSPQHRLGFKGQLQARPYWCISRQRSWGTPIPVAYVGDKLLINSEFIENVCNKIEKEGTDSWWSTPIEELVPESLLKEHNVGKEDLVKGMDIMDIWLDSGLSWSSVLEGKTADLYLEGVDQFTGWFQSSLMTSIALTGKAPYKSIFVHGFTVDSNGKKMSKSLGNVIDPKTVISGGKDLKKDPAYGVDTLRWWVASHGTQHSQIIISSGILAESHAEVSRIRLLIKFLLGAIADLDKPFHNPKSGLQLNYLDAYMLHQLYEFENTIKDHYEYMRFNKVCSTILNFTANQVSGLYCHSIKDRLYCFSKDDVQRKNCQIVLNHVLIGLCRGLAPILPHLVEEAWSYHPHYEVQKKPFFKNKFEEPQAIWDRPFCEFLMDEIFNMKKTVNRECIGKNSLEYSVKIIANAEFYDRILPMMRDSHKATEGVLCEVLQVSEVILEEGLDFSADWRLEIAPVDGKVLCGRCRRYTADHKEIPCPRCIEVMEQSSISNN